MSEAPTEENPRAGRRLKVGARSIPFTDCHVYGRHVIDTYHQIQRYDALGNLAHYGLKDVVQTLGLTPARPHLPTAPRSATLWRRDPETVRAYAIDDVLDVGRAVGADAADRVLPVADRALGPCRRSRRAGRARRSTT